MDNKYISKKANYDFATLKNKNHYNCSGTCCTCRYLNSRTDFDQQQYLRFQQLNNIDYGAKMFQSMKKKFY
jgi:hypothetical protein